VSSGAGGSFRAGPGAGFLVLLAALLLVASAACTPGGSPGAGSNGRVTTGVIGIVLAGPTCPVERAGQSACVRPVEGATILALDSARHETGRATSDATGAYFLPLPPGAYEIVPQPVSGLMGVAPASNITVTGGAPVRLDLRYDTGIR
jgi:hypothetical protein